MEPVELVVEAAKVEPVELVELVKVDRPGVYLAQPLIRAKQVSEVPVVAVAAVALVETVDAGGVEVSEVREVTGEVKGAITGA